MSKLHPELRLLRGKTETRRFQRETRPDGALELVLMLQDWSEPYNVGTLFRIADACGAKEVVLTGRTPAPPNPQISVTSLGNHRRVAWRSVVRHDDAIGELKAQGYSIVAVEVAEGARAYQEFEFPVRTCLVLGNEGKGVYPNVLRQCDAAVFIPMAGKGRSVNVAVAAAIVAFRAVLG